MCSNLTGHETSMNNKISNTSSSKNRTGIYPSEYSTPLCSVSSYSLIENEEENGILFPSVTLELPGNVKKQRKTRARKIREDNSSSHEHVVISQCIDRKMIDTANRRCSSAISRSQSCPTDPTRTASDSSLYESFNGGRRIISLGQTFSSIVEFFKNHPNFTKYLLAGLVFYAFVCNLEIFVPRIVAFFVRLLYPWCRYCVVIGEQFFSSIANMYTRLDAVIYASYCEFAQRNCRYHRLMCDVTCSFVDHVLSQSRAQVPPPIKQ